VCLLMSVLFVVNCFCVCFMCSWILLYFVDVSLLYVHGVFVDVCVVFVDCSVFLFLCVFCLLLSFVVWMFVLFLWIVAFLLLL